MEKPKIAGVRELGERAALRFVGAPACDAAFVAAVAGLSGEERAAAVLAWRAGKQAALAGLRGRVGVRR